MKIIKLGVILFCLASSLFASESNLPNLNLWGYQGWHPVNDYNEMRVYDFNSINPYHAATVYLTDMVTAKTIRTNYTREGSSLVIDGAKIGEIYLNGAIRFEIKSGSVDYIDAEDYAQVYYYDGDVNAFTIREMASIYVAGDWNCDRVVNFIDIAVFARVLTDFEELEFICDNWLKRF